MSHIISAVWIYMEKETSTLKQLVSLAKWKSSSLNYEEGKGHKRNCSHQGTAERWSLVAEITNRQINFWSLWKSLWPSRCGEVSYLVTSASHKSQKGQIMCKNYLFSSFQKTHWKKRKKTLKRLYLHLIPNQNAQRLDCWLQPAELQCFQGTTSNWHSLAVTPIYQRYFVLVPLLQSFSN